MASSNENDEKPLDTFILFNEREETVAAIVDRLTSRGISTHFWRRDIKPGQDWLELEERRLESARTVSVFLGRLGWGPTQRELALRAIKSGKRIIPVLVGDAVPEAMTDVGGIFKSRRYVDLRTFTPSALDQLIEAIRPRDNASRFDGLISRLVDGNEEERSAVLEQVLDGAIANVAGLADRLRRELSGRFNPEQERSLSSARDPRLMPSIRSWMLSVLIWTDDGSSESQQLILKHLDPAFETGNSVRFWVLAGLFDSKASYQEKAADLCLSDPAPDVALLAQGMLAEQRSFDPEFLQRIRSKLFSSDFDNEIWPALRVLRIVPAPLTYELCDLLDRGDVETPVAYDTLYALAHPMRAEEAAQVLERTRGVDRVLDIVVAVMRDSDPGATRTFVRLLAAFERPSLEQALTMLVARDLATAPLVNTIRQLLRDPSSRPTNVQRTFVAGYASDAIDVARDDLDIREDVQTLTAVMLAKEVTPPLAIGLFGDWGAGKSFFMRSMKTAAAKIAKEARDNGSDKFCTEVVPIEFNAWHYNDTNLWASLVSHILETLSLYVSPLVSAEQQQAGLVQQLNSARQVIQQIESERNTTEVQIAARQAQLQQLQLEREQKELELSDLRLSDLQSIFRKDPGLQRVLSKALADAGVPAVLTSFDDLNKALAEVNSLSGRAAALATGLFKAPNRLLVGGLTATVLALPMLGYCLERWLQSNMATIVTVVAEIATVVGGGAALLSKAASYVASNLTTVEAAKRKVDRALAERQKIPTDAEKQLQQEIVGLKTQEDQVATRLQAATNHAIDLEKRITALNESRSLAHFLSDRSKSDDYRKHLGVISTIRLDFESLTQQLANRQPPAGLKKVERIVLYIDDLDRCPHEKVVQVLEAVHLLLAYPLFVVVVGVDPRWLSYSLTSVFPWLKDTPHVIDGIEAKTRDDIWRPTPQNYLEKIFQIPFSLRPMSSAGYEKLVGTLFSAAAPASPSAQKTFADTPDLTATPDIDQPRPPDDLISPQPGPEPAAGPRPKPTPPPEPEFVIHEEAMVIKKQEGEFAKRLFELLPTPRATKRFSNTYRLLKAPIPLDKLKSFEGTEDFPGTFQVPMLLLAVLVGRSAEAAQFFPSLYDRVKNLDDGIDLSLSDILDFASPALRDIIRNIVSDDKFPRSAALFKKWLRRVARFSFEIGREIKPVSGVLNGGDE